MAIVMVAVVCVCVCVYRLINIELRLRLVFGGEVKDMTEDDRKSPLSVAAYF